MLRRIGTTFEAKTPAQQSDTSEERDETTP